MKLEVVLELTDVYGGDSQVRMEPMEERKLARTKRRVERRTDAPFLGARNRETTEVASETVERDVYTFRRDDKGRPLLRLGGSHGKVWGAFRDVAGVLKMTGVSPFTSSYNRILSCIKVMPMWVPLELNGESMTVEKLPQPLQGPRGGMIEQRFDVIPKCTARFTVVFPDPLEPAVHELVKGLEDLSLFNKRRASARVVSVTAC